MNFCNLCGNKLNFIIPEDDDRERFVCEDCGHIHYQNPRIIVGTLPIYEDKVLLYELYHKLKKEFNEVSKN